MFFAQRAAALTIVRAEATRDGILLRLSAGTCPADEAMRIRLAAAPNVFNASRKTAFCAAN